MKIYNTLTRKLEEFVPLNPGKVKMYVCGPTVYNYIHIGNARSVVAFDVVRKYLEYRGFAVDFVSNFTDVDDKIIHAAAAENVTTTAFSERYIAAFYEDIAALNVARATENPKASEYIYPMIDFIQDLLDKGVAYIADGDVYFRVAKAHDYAKLANKNLAELLDGASGRTDEETERKESPADFALWKAAKAGEVSWQAPWGQGRPGWHLECSVMSTKLLGDTLDIHGGGADLEFPHHTNEIAQSEAKTGKKFVNYWMHNGFVNVDGEKMSKSLGNFKTVHEMLAAGLNPQVLRFFLATTHYRRPVDFTDEALDAAENNLKKIENVERNWSDLEKIDLPFWDTDFGLPEGFFEKDVDKKSSIAIIYKKNEEDSEKIVTEFEREFQGAMDEDFNISNGLEVFYRFLSWINHGNAGHKEREFFDRVLQILGIKFSEEENLDAEIEALIEARQLAREVRDFAKSDQIRDELKLRGIILEDTKDGVRWHRE